MAKITGNGKKHRDPLCLFMLRAVIICNLIIYALPPLNCYETVCEVLDSFSSRNDFTNNEVLDRGTHFAVRKRHSVTQCLYSSHRLPPAAAQLHMVSCTIIGRGQPVRDRISHSPGQSEQGQSQVTLCENENKKAYIYMTV